MYEPDKTSFLNDYDDYMLFSGNERHYVDSRFEMNDPHIYESAEIGKFQLIAQRLLSKDVEKKYGGGDPQLDYSVLSVGVITLGLIMAVEFVRHLLDHAAKGRALFKTVLETAYNELATLGIVEFLLFLLTTYHPGYDKEKKAVFADVHFLLFYVAILNALQSWCLAAVAQRISHNMWIKSEELQSNQIIEIREEFQLLLESIENLSHVKRRKQKTTNRETDITRSEESAFDGNDIDVNIDTSNDQDYSSPTIPIERNFRWTSLDFSELWEEIKDRVKHERLKSKHHHLLLQLQYGELRTSFLKGHSMPLNLSFADYLIRCEIDILTRLVHVSPEAWLLLIGASNLLYFFLGMITYAFKDIRLAGGILIFVFFCSAFVFIVLAAITYNKMISILRSMIKDKSLWEEVNVMIIEKRERLMKLQISMFWGRDPKQLITAIQFMQFGYCVAIASVLIFWSEINDAKIPMYAYLVALLTCYFVFLFFIGRVIPIFTMCTSLAQLPNMKLLRETLAAFHLEQEERKQIEVMSQSIDHEVTGSADIDKTMNTKETVVKDTFHAYENGYYETARSGTELFVDSNSGRDTITKIKSSFRPSPATALRNTEVDGVHCASSPTTTMKGEESIESVPFKQRLAQYFRSKKYIVLSHLLGTMAVFFFVAKRVEYFLHSEAIISKRHVSFQFDANVTFWILFFWLVCFLCASALVFYAMFPLTSRTTVLDKKVIVAALIDAILTFSCLVIFLAAESQRCCESAEGDNDRFLEDSGETNYGEICSCPAFGHRTYGGLGKLEPFVSLVGLRGFRYYLAKRIVQYYEKSEDEEAEIHQSSGIPFSVLDEVNHEHSGHHVHHDELIGTAFQVWEAALVKHPDLVRQYGEFSGELLRAMLGVPVSVVLQDRSRMGDTSHNPHLIT